MSWRAFFTVCVLAMLAAWYVLVTIDRHVKEHRHCAPYAMSSIERAERAERDAMGKADGCHDRSVTPGAADKHVRETAP